MYKVNLNNGKSFSCDAYSTIFEAAKSSGIILEHSCLTARCKSCAVQIVSGTTVDKLDDLVLSAQEKLNKWTLSCNSLPTSDLVLDIEDLNGIQIFEKKIIPVKIQSINKLNETVIEVNLRLPPNLNFRYNSGQYVNITRGQIKRSYSIANAYQENSLLTFIIKKYENGQMSNYWFNEAKESDLLRIEGPIGSFFLRESTAENIIFLATGTGIAPIRAILESINLDYQKYQNKKFRVYNGARYESDFLWNPSEIKRLTNLKYIPVLSKETERWKGENGYVQDIILKDSIDLSNTQVYACGSNDMIESAKKTLVENGLNENQFFSDAFVQSN